MKAPTLITGVRSMENQLEFLLIQFHSFAERCKYIKRANTRDKISACDWATNSSSQLLLGHGTSSSKEYKVDDTESCQHEGVSVRYQWCKNKKIKYERNCWSNHWNAGTVEIERAFREMRNGRTKKWDQKSQARARKYVRQKMEPAWSCTISWWTWVPIRSHQ